MSEAGSAAWPMQAGEVPAPSEGESERSVDATRLVFTGTAREFFGIWLVNVVLTLLTLGIYSAWAKVRTQRYFHGNTSLDGQALDYLAPPIAILKGRLIVVVVLAAIAFANTLHEVAQIVTTVLLLLVFPWVICRSLRFRARVTAWRNVRFHWTGTYWGIFKVFYLWPLFGIVTFGFGYPVALRAQKRYIANQLEFGTEPFMATPRLGPFYGAFFLSFLIALCISIPLGLLVSVVMTFVNALIGPPDPTVMIGPIPVEAWRAIPPAVPGVVAAFAAFAFYEGMARKALLNAMVIEGPDKGRHHFSSTLEGLHWFVLVLGNAAAIVFTLGLATPWARIRAWRAQAEALEVRSGGSREAFVDDQRRRGDAFSSEFADIEGIDIGL